MRNNNTYSKKAERLGMIFAAIIAVGMIISSGTITDVGAKTREQIYNNVAFDNSFVEPSDQGKQNDLGLKSSESNDGKKGPTSSCVNQVLNPYGCKFIRTDAGCGVEDEGLEISYPVDCETGERD